MFAVALLHGNCTHTQRLHPSLLCPPSAGVTTHTGSSKITSPSTIQDQHRHPSQPKDLSCQHGPPAALPSTLKHGTVHALIFLVCSQPFASHILRWADAHKSTPQKATVIAHALAMSVGVCMDPPLTRAGRQPAAGALVPVHRLQHGKKKTAYSRCTYSTSSTNTLVASRHSSAHPGMPKSDVELSASNATIPAHMSAPPEKTHKSQTSPFTCHPNIIPTHRDTPNRSIRHPNAPPHTIT
ncbi:hypothetical protein TcCL_ESM05264 [Trypanosoma cruzi]|uniref:Uncharacterized protein n=1 Tax=Trypanosoma cruzi (strain CL Brener) TaxID=353153 RepID=Q4CWA3_TRYCC|nr:hypothetical protein Tc00.1047053511611.11 [Trypanosoma cruzi]EAN84555.1 hypothetical protein Tc00.1047053511611.11 [Trypanosoma cruzi]RNC57193.1 hypothetical protein TcCL_ESM05264 [Trypanosoma cruzi]|eukprot:XP_806406.1 hypothetical protein [Trypanosoma cruzi strain CL Brener]